MKKIAAIILTLLLSANICLAEVVMFNTKTLKYHRLNCQHAIKCTVNCVKVEKQQAKNRGGIPCKVCGG